MLTSNYISSRESICKMEAVIALLQRREQLEKEFRQITEELLQIYAITAEVVVPEPVQLTRLFYSSLDPSSIDLIKLEKDTNNKKSSQSEGDHRIIDQESKVNVVIKEEQGDETDEEDLPSPTLTEEKVILKDRIISSESSTKHPEGQVGKAQSFTKDPNERKEIHISNHHSKLYRYT